MKDLTFDEFVGKGIQPMIDVFQGAARGNEIYRIKTHDSGSFVMMSADEYNIHHDALKILLQNSDTVPKEWLEKFKGESEE